jgi:hypothetical protein
MTVGREIAQSRCETGMLVSRESAIAAESLMNNAG